VILLFITISTVLLAVQSPLDDPNTTMAHVLTYIDYGMTAIFTFEMVIKMISFGLLFNGKDSYLYNGWNILDFVIVTSAIVGLIPGTGDISFLKALRMLRILRPLRLISRNRSLKLAILCLIKAIPSILNLMLIVLFFIFLLGILGTTLFSGKFYTCHMDDMIAEQEGKPALMQNMYYSTEAVKGFEQFIVTKFDCLNYGGEWINSDLNFDTTFTSIITLITIQTTEGWIGVMWNAVDTTKVGFVPIVGQNPQYILLFILLIILICLLFLNLFVGVVCDTFNTEKTKQTNNGLLKEIEKQWIEVQLLAYEAAPVIYIKEQVNDISCFRNFLIRMINHTLFDSFIIMCILLNTLVLACAWYDQSEMIKGVLVNVNYVFMAIFTIEAVLKLIAMKQHYFKDGWNCFDFFVVVCTLIALTIANIPAL
jgi:flagellar basal body-associated protein FliL